MMTVENVISNCTDLSTSSLKALVSALTPIASFALSTRSGKSLSRSVGILNSKSLFFSSSDLSAPGLTLTSTLVEVLRRSISSVAKRVHRVSLIGKRTPDIASKTELFPDDWSSHTTSWGKGTWRSIPQERRWSITSSNFPMVLRLQDRGWKRIALCTIITLTHGRFGDSSRSQRCWQAEFARNIGCVILWKKQTDLVSRNLNMHAFPSPPI